MVAHIAQCFFMNHHGMTVKFHSILTDFFNAETTERLISDLLRHNQNII